MKTVRMLGTRGVPAAHGGFETAADHVSRYLVDRGWRVVVYCQVEGDGLPRTDMWEGVERVVVPTKRGGALGTAEFDARATRHAVKHAAEQDEICLVFGYNTAFLNLRQRIRRIPFVMNMDGIEYVRAKWSPLHKAVLWTNEWIGAKSATHLIADHPEIATHLATRTSSDRITTIAYGAPLVTEASPTIPESFGLEPGRYLTVIARPEPENSLLEIVSGFSRRPRGVRLAVLGAYSPETTRYQAQVLAAAGDEVSFLGPQYEPEIVQALRFHSSGYVHGHTVGGTNPSLVEALGCGNPVLAHDNKYNRWVAGDAARYFSSADTFDTLLCEFLDDTGERQSMAASARARHAEAFTWERVGAQYEQLLAQFVTTE
ncbi:MAG: DUF1972 domain-containing protein [Nocardioidaceae bacterium]